MPRKVRTGRMSSCGLKLMSSVTSDDAKLLKMFRRSSVRPFLLNVSDVKDVRSTNSDSGMAERNWLLRTRSDKRVDRPLKRLGCSCTSPVFSMVREESRVNPKYRFKGISLSCALLNNLTLVSRGQSTCSKPPAALNDSVDKSEHCNVVEFTPQEHATVTMSALRMSSA